MMSILFQPVTRIMTTEILCGSPDLPVSEAALRMSEKRCSSILVTDAAGCAVGIWTEADALKSELNERSRQPLTLSQVMSSPVVTLSATTTVHDAVVTFHDKGIRHALIAGENGHLGILSMTDIIRHQGGESFLGLRRLDTLETRPPCVLESGQTLQVVRLSSSTYSILTQRDIVRLVAQGQQNVALSKVCTRSLLAVSGRTTLTDARCVLMAHQLRHLGVLDAAGELSGLIGFFDILHSMEQAFLLELHQMLYERDQALSESQHSLLLAEKVFESTMEGIIITDGNGVILSVNPAFSRVTGYSSEEVVGRTPALLSSGKQLPGFYAYFWKSLKIEGRWQG